MATRAAETARTARSGRTPTERWSWDRVRWASHCGNCIANCAYRIYAAGDRVVWQEQSGGIPGYEGIPDMNPLGCQKGGAWHTQALGDERLLHPLRRVGERGSGEWEEISWDAGARRPSPMPSSTRSRRRVRTACWSTPAPSPAWPGAWARSLLCATLDVRRDGLQLHGERRAPRALDHLRQPAGRLRRRRHVQSRHGDHLERQPRLHPDPLLPLPPRSPLQGRDRGHHLARPQPLGDPRRHARTDPPRHRRGPLPGDLPGDPRRGMGRPRLRAVPDRSAVPGARRHRAVPPPGGDARPTAGRTGSTSGAPRGSPRSIPGGWTTPPSPRTSSSRDAGRWCSPTARRSR